MNSRKFADKPARPNEGLANSGTHTYGGFVQRHRTALLVLGMATLCRVMFHALYRPWWCGDTPGYTATFYLWAHGQAADGSRTAIYPLFLGLAQWLAGSAPEVRIAAIPAIIATVGQSILGITSSWLLYDTLRTLRVRSRIAFPAAIFFASLAVVCEFEMLLLPLSLSLSALVVGAWVFTKMMTKAAAGSRAVLLPVVLGVAFACAALVRPENLVFFVVLMGATAAVGLRLLRVRDVKPRGRVLLRNSIVACASAAPLILAWMTWNYIGTGQFRITTLSTWNLSASVYNMFDRVRPEHKVLGEILTRNYQKRLVRDHIWSAVPELLARSGEMPMHHRSFPANANAFMRMGQQRFGIQPNGPLPADLGDYIGAVCRQLMKDHPAAWVYNVTDNFFHDTFKYSYPQPPPGVPWESPNGKYIVKTKSLSPVANAMNTVQAPILLLCYVAALALVLLAPHTILATRTPSGIEHVTVTALALGTVMTFVACCILACFNQHYGEPHYGVLVICAAYAAELGMRRWENYRSRRNTVADQSLVITSKADTAPCSPS